MSAQEDDVLGPKTLFSTCKPAVLMPAKALARHAEAATLWLTGLRGKGEGGWGGPETLRVRESEEMAESLQGKPRAFALQFRVSDAALSQKPT